jgi:hypothetical protein
MENTTVLYSMAAAMNNLALVYNSLNDGENAKKMLSVFF